MSWKKKHFMHKWVLLSLGLSCFCSAFFIRLTGAMRRQYDIRNHMEKRSCFAWYISVTKSVFLLFHCFQTEFRYFVARFSVETESFIFELFDKQIKYCHLTMIFVTVSRGVSNQQNSIEFSTENRFSGWHTDCTAS